MNTTQMDQESISILPYDENESQEDNGSGFHTSHDLEIGNAYQLTEGHQGTFDLHGKDSDVASNLGNL